MGYAMRTNRYRYVEWLDAVSGQIVAKELYDHQSDPEENTNLATEETHQANVKMLNEKLWNTLDKPSFPLLMVSQETIVKPDETNEVLAWSPIIGSAPIPASKPAGVFQSVTFTNQRKNSVELVWLGPDGTEKVYQTLASEGSFRIKTRPGIVWLIRSTEGESLGYFVVEPRSKEQSAAIIPN